MKETANKEIVIPDQIHEFFVKEHKQVADQTIYLHEAGMAKELDPTETSFFRAKVEAGGEKMLDLVNYLAKKKIRELPNKMIRLD